MSDGSIDQIRQLIAEGAIEDALQAIDQLLSGYLATSFANTQQFRELRSDTIVMTGKLRRSERRGRLGIDDPTSVERVLTQTSAATANLLDDVTRWIKRVNGPSPTLSPSLTSSEGVLVSAPWLLTERTSTQEKIWGRGNLQSLNWLHTGLKCARPVARVVGASRVGTGFLIGSNLLMTNNHVLPSKRSSNTAFAEFNFEEDENGQLKHISRYKFE